MAARWLCAAVGATAERLPLALKVPRRYTRSRELLSDRPVSRA
jgi:hypothetical protein